MFQIRLFQTHLRFRLRWLAGEKLPPVRGCVSGLSRGSCSTGDKASNARLCGAGVGVLGADGRGRKVGGAGGEGAWPDDYPHRVAEVRTNVVLCEP